MEENPFYDAHERIEQLNADIATQNERFVLSSSISDEEFRALAVTTLTEEQQRSVDARFETSQAIDYDEIVAEWSSLLQAGDALRNEADSVERTIADIEAQAELSAKIVPSAADQVRGLADTKISHQREVLRDIQAQIADLDGKELGFVAVTQPWTIPALPVTQPSIETQPTIEAEITPDSLVSETEPQTEKLDKTEKLDETELKRVLWAVFDHARAAGDNGVRIEEMRKTVPELAALSKEHYTYFKHNFAGMRTRIVDMLADMGYGVEWEVSGQTRGTRYHVQEKQLRPQIRTDRVFTSRPAAEATQAAQPTAHDAAPEHTTVGTPSNTPTLRPDSAPATPPEQAPRSAAPDILGQAAVEAAVEPVAASEQQKSGKTVKFIKNASGSAVTIGQCNVVEVPVEDVARHLGIKRNPHYAREVEKWIDWLESNPQSPASKRVRAYKGLRLGQYETQLPLYRFAPKDAVGLKVPRHFLRHRVVYTMVESELALIEVLDHDAFDRKYH